MLRKQASPGLLTLNPFSPLLPLSGTSFQNWKWVLDINVHVLTKFSQQVIQKKHCSLNDLQRNGWPRDIPINIWREICKASQVPRCVSRATHSIPRVHRKPTLHHGAIHPFLSWVARLCCQKGRGSAVLPGLLQRQRSESSCSSCSETSTHSSETAGKFPALRR